MALTKSTIANKRLKRLIESGLKPIAKPSKHILKLKKILKEKINEKTLKKQAIFFNALSDLTRLKILKLLTKDELCNCEIMVALNLTQPTVSHHLNILERAGIIEEKRIGKWAFYSISNKKIIEILDRIESLIESI